MQTGEELGSVPYVHQVKSYTPEEYTAEVKSGKSQGRLMPVQKPGKSRQDYGTPTKFLDAVKNRLRIDDFTVDLAATAENAVTNLFIGEQSNSFTIQWHRYKGWCWLNPPFADIMPWVEKAAIEASLGAHVAVLVPASFSDWWVKWVEPHAYINFLHGRLKFVGEQDYYPKDCALLLYTPWGMTGNEVWDWRV